jgi:hypothetical protein
MMPSNDTLFEVIYICLSTDDCALNYAEQILKNDFNRQLVFSVDRYFGLREELRNILAPPSSTNVTEEFKCFQWKKQLYNCSKNRKRCHSNILDRGFQDGYCSTDETIFINIEKIFQKTINIFSYSKESTKMDYSCNYTECNANKLDNELINLVQQQYTDSYLMNDFLTMTSPKTTRKPTRLTTSMPQKTDDFNRSSQYEEETEQVIKTTSFSYSLSINNNTTLKADATMIDYHRIYRLIAFFIAFYNI